MGDEEIQVLLQELGLPDPVKTDLYKMTSRDHTISNVLSAEIINNLSGLKDSLMGSIKRNKTIAIAIQLGKDAALEAKGAVDHERRMAKSDRSHAGKEERRKRSTQMRAHDIKNYFTSVPEEFRAIAHGAFETAMLEAGHDHHHDDEDHPENRDDNGVHKAAYEQQKSEEERMAYMGLTSGIKFGLN